YESPVGFRHGPKSLINDQTLVLVFGSIDPYTRQYDLDLVREVAGDKIARQVVLLTDQAAGIERVREVFVEASADSLDIYRAFPYIIYGQLISLLTSLKVQNRPDTPSPTGTVNRVVQGVIIHPFHKE
ncbi:MAG: tagatose-6-phosphate ketose isomerase, partial [Streptococcus sp.]